MDHADGHRYFEGLAVAHVLGGLDDSEGRVFRAHLLECGSCRARVGELRAIAHDLADVERDERRVRAAQAIDTKRRETEDEVDVAVEPMPSPRSSRITVVVGLILIIGLSLWNFTLRSAMTMQETRVAAFEEKLAITETGEPWTISDSVPDVDASVKFEGSRFVVVADGLDPAERYGLYVEDAAGKVILRDSPTIEDDGRLSSMYDLEEAGEPALVLLMNPADADVQVGTPTVEPLGEPVFQASPPID